MGFRRFAVEMRRRGQVEMREIGNWGDIALFEGWELMWLGRLRWSDVVN